MTEKKEEQKPKHFFSFVCVKKNHKFEIEGDGPSNTQFDVPKMRCPVCSGTVQLKLSVNVASASKSQKSIENARKDNRDRSRMAMEAAANHRIANPEPEMVELQYAPGKGGGSNRPEKVPKSVIEQIERKVASELQE